MKVLYTIILLQFVSSLAFAYENFKPKQLFSCYQYNSEADPIASIYEVGNPTGEDFIIQVFIPNHMDDQKSGVTYSYQPPNEDYLTLGTYGLETTQPHFKLELSGQLQYAVIDGNSARYTYHDLKLSSPIHDLNRIECFKENPPDCSIEIKVLEEGGELKLFKGMAACG